MSRVGEFRSRNRCGIVVCHPVQRSCDGSIKQVFKSTPALLSLQSPDEYGHSCCRSGTNNDVVTPFSAGKV